MGDERRLLGFTRKEEGVILFLLIAFVLGSCVWIYRRYFEPLPTIQEEDIRFDRHDQKDTTAHESNVMNHDEIIVKINLNTASEKELDDIPGIGPVTATRICQYRETHGPFREINELVNVKGIGQVTLKKMKPYLTIK